MALNTSTFFILVLLGSAAALTVQNQKPLRDHDFYPYPGEDNALNELIEVDEELVNAPEKDFNFLVPELIRNTIRAAASLNRSTWLKTGTPSEVKLKQAFASSPEVAKRVAWRCKHAVKEQRRISFGEVADDHCRWQQEDVLLCKGLDMAGWYHELGDDQRLEEIINMSFQPAVIDARSSAAMKVSTGMRAQIIGKYMVRHEEGVAHEEKNFSRFEKMKNRIIESDAFQAAVDQVCPQEMIDFRPNCPYHSHRGLWCQSMMIAANINVGTEKLMPVLEGMLALNDDAVKMLDSPYFAGLKQSQQEVFRRAAEMNRGAWLKSGGSNMTLLRETWQEWPQLQDKARVQCKLYRISGFKSECVWRKTDYMLIQFLEKAGDRLFTDPKGFYLAHAKPQEVDRVEEEIKALMNEDAIDWYNLQLMMAKWTEVVDSSNRGRQHIKEYVKMRQRIQKSAQFKELVEKTCWPINHLRPGCWDRAPHDLFYIAVAQATCRINGPTAVFNRLRERWNE